MAFENPLGTNNIAIFEASTGLLQYTFVSLSTASKLTLPTTNQAVIGVLVSSGTTGSTRDDQVQSVQVYGVAKVLAGSSAIDAGDLVSAATADGRLAASSTNGVLGIALASVTSTSTASHVIPVLLQYYGQTG